MVVWPVKPAFLRRERAGSPAYSVQYQHWTSIACDPHGDTPPTRTGREDISALTWPSTSRLILPYTGSLSAKSSITEAEAPTDDRRR
jgi:hypothetical protein